FVVRDGCLQRLMEERGEIGFTRGDEGLKVSTHAIAAGQHFVARQVAERRLCRSLVVPPPESSPVPRKLAQLRFEPVIVATAHGFETGRLSHETRDLGQIASEWIARPRARAPKLCDLRQ